MLNDTQIKSAKPKDKKYLLNDGKGLYLRVDPSGRKYWLMRFKEGGKSHELSLGAYPEVSLKQARGDLLSVRGDKNPTTFRRPPLSGSKSEK